MAFFSGPTLIVGLLEMTNQAIMRSLRKAEYKKIQARLGQSKGI